mgnify:FL=1
MWMFLFLLPWQTIFIFRQVKVNDFLWPYGTLGFYGVEIIFWGVVASFIFLYVKKQTITFSSMRRSTWLFFSIIAFFLYSYLSMLWAPDNELVLQHTRWIMQGFLLFFLLSWKHIRLWDILIPFIAGSAVQSIFAIWQFLSQSTGASSTLLGLTEHVSAIGGTSVIVSDTERWLRAYGAFPHPNILGGYLLVGLLSVFILGWVYNKYLRTSSWKYVLLFVTILHSVALFMTWSRSALLGLVLLLFISGVYAWRHKKYIFFVFHMPIIISLSAFAIIYAPLVSTRISGESMHEVRSLVERVDGVSVAIDLFKSAWFSGVGVGNYTAALMAYDSRLPGYLLQPLHVAPGVLLIEYGVFGIVLSCALFWFFYSLYIREQKRYLLLILAFVPILLVDHYMYTSMVGIFLFAFVMGVLVRMGAEKSHS